MPADVRQQLQFLFKVDGDYFEFDAAEALLHLFPDAPVHLVTVSHPSSVQNMVPYDLSLIHI